MGTDGYQKAARLDIILFLKGGQTKGIEKANCTCTGTGNPQHGGPERLYRRIAFRHSRDTGRRVPAATLALPAWSTSANWGEYIDMSVLEDFEAETGIAVNYQDI